MAVLSRALKGNVSRPKNFSQILRLGPEGRGSKSVFRSDVPIALYYHPKKCVNNHQKNRKKSGLWDQSEKKFQIDPTNQIFSKKFFFQGSPLWFSKKIWILKKKNFEKNVFCGIHLKFFFRSIPQTRFFSKKNFKIFRKPKGGPLEKKNLKKIWFVGSI